MTASKIIILARGLQRVIANHLRTGRFKRPLVVSLITALNAEMAKRFHRIEFNSLLWESSILDPRFKRKTSSDDQAATEAFQRLTTAAAQATTSNPSQQEALVEQGAAGGQPSEESLIWGDFDVQVSGLVGHISAGAEASLEIRSFLQEALIPRSSNPLTWWKSRSVIYPRLTQLMMERLCVVATSVPSERVFSKMGLIISVSLQGAASHVPECEPEVNIQASSVPRGSWVLFLPSLLVKGQKCLLNGNVRFCSLPLRLDTGLQRPSQIRCRT